MSIRDAAEQHLTDRYPGPFTNLEAEGLAMAFLVGCVEAADDGPEGDHFLAEAAKGLAAAYLKQHPNRVPAR